MFECSTLQDLINFQSVLVNAFFGWAVGCTSMVIVQKTRHIFVLGMAWSGLHFLPNVQRIFFFLICCGCDISDVFSTNTHTHTVCHNEPNVLGKKSHQLSGSVRILPGMSNPEG